MRRTLARLAKAGAWALAAVVGLSGLVWAWNKPPEPRLVLKDPAGVRVLRFSPNGRLLLTQTADDTAMHVWDVATGERRVAIPLDGDQPCSQLFSPSGRWLFESGRGFFRIWDTADGSKWEHRDPNTRNLTVHAFSPDEHWMALHGRTSDDTYAVHIWDLKERRSRATIPYSWLEGGPLLVTFSPDWWSLLISDDHGTRLWDLSAGATRWAICEQFWPAWFTPDGRSLIAVVNDDGSGDPAAKGRVVVWDTETGWRRLQLPAEPRHGRYLDVSPDGRSFVTVT